MWLYSNSVIEARGLEQLLAVPHTRGRLPLGDEGGISRGEDRGLDVLDLEVVLLVEHVVHGRQHEVFVRTPVAGDVVGVEQGGVVPWAVEQEIRIGRGVDVDQEGLVRAHHGAVRIAHEGIVGA